MPTPEYYSVLENYSTTASNATVSRANSQTNQTSFTIREHNSIAKCFSTLSVLHFSDIWDSNACRNPDESGNAALHHSRRLNS